MTIRTSAKVAVARQDNGVVVATLDGDNGSEEIRASHLLIAAGRRPQTTALALDEVGVKLGQKGEVVVDDQLRTSNERIWAAGDVTGHPQFVYVAGVQGAVAVDNAFENAARTIDYRTLPRVTFTTPNVASVGITEFEAQEAGIECECRSIPLDLVPRALVNRDTRGVVKIVAESKTGIVRGVHMLAPNAGDAILAAVYAIECRMTVKQVANIWCPYLTVSEVMIQPFRDPPLRLFARLCFLRLETRVLGDRLDYGLDVRRRSVVADYAREVRSDQGFP